MNVYEADIWCQVKRGGVFSHTVVRRQSIHALNEERARKKITLKKGYVRDNPPLEVTDEFIYRIKETGTVTKQMCYVYSDGRSPRPVK